MSDPFLALPGTKRKRSAGTGKPLHRQEKPQLRKSAGQKGRRLRDTSQSDNDDEIGPGGIESDIDVDVGELEETEESDHEEAPAERRLRLAKDYLEKVRLETGRIGLSMNSDNRNGFRRGRSGSGYHRSKITRGCRRSKREGVQAYCRFIVSSMDWKTASS
jgi:hypothetical protein